MIDNDIHLKLLANVPIDVGVGMFQLPSVKEIIDMGESTYYGYFNMVNFKKDILQSDEDFEELSDFEVMGMVLFHSPLHREMAIKAYKLFLNKDMKVTRLDDSYVIFFDDLGNVLSEEIWEYVKKVSRIGNFVQDSKEEYKAANEKARKLIEKIMNRKKQEVPKEEKINLRSILSAVAWRTNGIDSLLDKTIYQLYDGFYRLRFVDSYNQIYTGIYTGNVDQSKIKLPDYDWANVINIK
jgi:hypothetical protein